MMGAAMGSKIKTAFIKNDLSLDNILSLLRARLDSLCSTLQLLSSCKHFFSKIVRTLIINHVFQLLIVGFDMRSCDIVEYYDVD